MEAQTVSWRSNGAVLAIIVLLGFLPAHVKAQPAVGAPEDQASIEKRVGELEELVKKLQAERQAGPPAAPAAASAKPEPAAVAKPDPAATAKPSGDRTIQAVEGAAAKDPSKNAAANSGSGDAAGGSTLVDDASKSSSDGSFIQKALKYGFTIKSDDGISKLRITGQIEADLHNYLDEHDTADVDTFFLRRARLGIEADMLQYYEFRFLPDFGEDRVVIEDCYINVHYIDEFQVEVGKFKQPFSYEQLIQDRFVPTNERSLIDQLVPERDVGIMADGQKLFGNRLDWFASISNGTINGDTDTNNYKDFNARIAVRPFNEPDTWEVLRYLQLGFAITTGIEQEPINPNTLRTPGFVPFFKFNSTVQADGLRNRYSPELAYFCGPFGFVTQYYYERQDMIANGTTANPTVIPVHFEGGFVMATLLLTGETRTTYSFALEPLHNFNPSHPFACGGAWELVGRVSRLHIGDIVFAPGANQLANPALYSSGCTETTVGFNWYLNKWVRVQFNWEHAMFDQPVQLAPAPYGRLGHQDTLLSRLQIIF